MTTDETHGDPAHYRLPAVEMGGGARTPAVFLHGFAGAAVSWRRIQQEIARARPTLAFDLPGHAGARDFPGFGPPKVAARAVIAELDRRGIGTAHIVGHSMGSAVAALIGLFDAGRVASLVLLSPGGFGPEIGAGTLRGIVEGDDAEAAFRAMGAPGWRPCAETLALYDEIRRAQSPTALAAIYALMFRGGMQGVLPLDAVAAMGMPVNVVWGEEDAVTPFAQSGFMPPSFALTTLPRVGHMPMDEAPDETVAAISAAITASESRYH